MQLQSGSFLPHRNHVQSYSDQDLSQRDGFCNGQPPHSEINEHWHKAAQALYSFGFVILLSTLLLALLHLCCRCCCQKPFSLATVVGSLIVAGSMLIAAAIAVFMAFLIKQYGISIEDLTGSKGEPRFDWACFVAVGGVACALISSVFFICEGCRHDGSRSYDGYETARTI